MPALGLRCSNKDYSYCILDGTRSQPMVIKTATVNYPNGYAKPQSLKWFLQELHELIAKNTISIVVIKGFEGMTRGASFTERIEHESMVFLACANVGLKRAFRKIKSTIAKDLGMKGRARYLDTQVDKTVIPGFDKYSDKVREAILAAWSELR